MGIPYSREINQAFEQVTPLVAAGFEVLQTTKNIAILLACIQVLTVILLGLILLALLALVCAVNPDLEQEREELVTPAVKWLASWLLAYGTAAKWLLRVFFLTLVLACTVFAWQSFMAGASAPADAEGEEEQEEEGGKEEAGEKVKEEVKKDENKNNKNNKKKKDKKKK
ncbi:hypothetical protein B0A52_01125 [Exophiala mesophila]|uniref:Uncharacterized protein n=1 Tax=Exophiala mesophila TaxID=212818 RepID=A0A438NGJ2_EXOME|nr:hypothetical protein B0A52_01125 [Exophiala mesophila]